jgi:site-specific recombinase
MSPPVLTYQHHVDRLGAVLDRLSLPMDVWPERRCVAAQSVNLTWVVAFSADRPVGTLFAASTVSSAASGGILDAFKTKGVRKNDQHRQ